MDTVALAPCSRPHAEQRSVRAAVVEAPPQTPQLGIDVATGFEAPPPLGTDVATGFEAPPP